MSMPARGTGGPELARPSLVRLGYVSAFGALLAAMFALASLSPSLAPRAPVIQGVATGVLAAIGYEIGLALVWLWRWLQLPEAGARRHRLLRLLCWGLAAAVIALAFALTGTWADETRAVAGLPPLKTVHYATIALVAIAVFAAVWIVARSFWWCVGSIDTRLSRFVPPRVSRFAGIAIGLMVFYALLEGVAVRYVLQAADASYKAADSFIDPEQSAPQDPSRTGSAASLVRWKELGRQGRAFIASAPTAREIAAATGAPAMDPIRVYVGLRSADTPEARAEIALRELIRVGGFERSVLVVASPTGTGWMDPGAHDTLDFMLAGDVATVGVQYSYLSSPLAVTFYPELGIDQTRALFEAVYDHWTGLPEETRPRLYAFGLSAGAFNVQSTLSLLDMLADPVDGAFWAGSPFLSPYWQIVRERRDGGSPIWRPRFGDGSAVRTMNQDGEGDAPQAPWGPIRFVFLQYGSDPIVFFSPDDAIRRPAWLRAPRAPDVAPQIRWVPIVTMLQTALDMTIAVQVPRFGHYYAAEDYLDGWAALLSPPGWSPQRARAVREAATARIANP